LQTVGFNQSRQKSIFGNTGQLAGNFIAGSGDLKIKMIVKGYYE
jgi:hypothetical protein